MARKRKYTSIEDMPVSVFHEVAATGNYSLIGAGCTESDWGHIFDSFLMRFGYLEDYAKIPKLKLEAVRLYSLAYSGKGKHNLTLAEMKEKEIETIIASEQGGVSDVWAAAANVSKVMGFRINPAEVSVVEFYSYVRVKR